MQIFRTDQVGSLLRPDSLLMARDEWLAGRMSRDELSKAEDAAILEALALQKQVGISIFTDGEMRRDAWQTGISAAVSGFAAKYPIVEYTRPDGSKVSLQMHTKVVEGKLKQHDRIARSEAEFLKRHAPGPFKITIASPVGTARSTFRDGVTDKAYPTIESLRDDLTEIVRNEMTALAEEGAAYLQLDEGFATYCISESRERLKSQGITFEVALADDIAAENTCYDAVRSQFPDVTLATHICRGNRFAWTPESGGYDEVAQALFSDLHVDRFVLEYDSERAGGFEPLRYLPEGKVAVLGLVSTKNPQLESQDALLRRLDEASKFCPIERLALGPQCGFQSSAMRDGAFMTIDDERRKLELIVETAAKVWK